MRTLSARARVIVLGSLVAAWTVLAACTVEEENPATTRNRGTGTTLDGSATGADGSSTTNPNNNGPLCGKYGGPTGVQSIAQTIVANSKSDCRISPTVVQAEQQRAINFTDCWTTFVQGNFGCPGISFSLGTTKDSKGEACNSQMPGVKFSELDFATFMDDVATTLEAKGVSADDVRLLAPAFNGASLKLIVDPSETKHRQCAPNCSQGGQACIRPILDAGPDVITPQDSGPNDSGIQDAADSG